MTPGLDASVELLERSLGYTRLRLAEIDARHLDRSTPCAGWTIADLLAHMEDSLDAFTEAAAGAVEVRATGAATGRVDAIRAKACGLLAAWSAPAPGDVLVGGMDLPSPLLVATAALEITVHGWDVGQAVGSRAPVPTALAAELLPVARLTVTDPHRARRFAAPVPARAGDPDDVRLLAHLGRAT